MAEYRIVASIDPSGVTSGSAKVKQELRGVETAARATEKKIDDVGQAANRTSSSFLGMATGSRENSRRQVEQMRAMTEASRAAERQRQANDAAARSTDKLGRSAKGTATEQRSLDAATMRVLRAVDQEAAEIERLNRLLEDARRLHREGAIDAEHFARIEQMAATGIDEATQSMHRQRIGYRSLGYQVRDFIETVASGGNPLQALATQSGMTGAALQRTLGPTGSAGKVASFLSGPWSIAIIAVIAVVGQMASKFIEAANELDDMTEKLREDAEEAERTREAQQLFGNTIEGVTEALRRNREALEQLDDQHKTAARRALENAAAAAIRLQTIRATTAALVDQAAAEVLIARFAARQGQGGDAALEYIQRAEEHLVRMREALANTDREVAEAERQIQDALSRRVVELADRDPVERIRDRYDRLINAARERAIAEGTVSTELARQVRLLRDARDAEIRRHQESQRQSRQSDGVPRFRSRQQAIGIAGREMLRGGLQVGENEQFGGVRGNHPGMGNRAHGMFAIDVNVGTGNVEANIPDMRRRFDELARRYQARGYRVLWNGQVYEANGSGPSGPIRGSNQHRDHMHVEAPRTIVGRPTQGSDESSEITAEQRAMREAEQQADFVDQVVTQASTRGLPPGQANALAAQLERTFADFRRRFDREVSPEERARITNALTEADARETARRFDEAYVEPLNRLQRLQGTTGLSRAILNEQIEESIRLGRELTPVENETIENSFRHGDAMARQAGILESVRRPLEEYRAQIAALNALLARGEISQTQFNARISELGEAASRSLRDLPGLDPNTGLTYGDLAARAEEDARYAQELADFESNREQLLQMGISYNALIEAAHRRHVENMNAIDRARYTVALTAAQQTSESLVSIAEASVGKQSAIYKALFIASKAFAIADAIIKIQQGIANALSLPFPANLAAVASVAAAAASIISSIQAVHLNLRDGGYVRGPGGPRDDGVPANLSDGEFVINAQATARHRALLEAINNGTLTARTRRAASDGRLAPVSAAGDSFTMQFGDVIVQTGGGVTAADGRSIGRDVRATLVGIVRSEIADAKRDGGALTTTRQSVMAGG